MGNAWQTIIFYPYPLTLSPLHFALKAKVFRPAGLKAREELTERGAAPLSQALLENERNLLLYCYRSIRSTWLTMYPVCTSL